MRKRNFLILLMMFLCPLAFATLSSHGPYLGGQIGYANTHSGDVNPNWKAFRAFGGWRFDDHFALEGAYDDIIRDGSKKMYGGDIFGKAIVPLALNLSAYIKAGGEYIHQDINDEVINRLLAAAAIGFGFNLTKGINLDISWTHAWGHSGMRNIDFAAFGLSFTL